MNDKIPHGAQIELKCNANHVLVGVNINMCINGNWALEWPTCQARCNVDDITSFTYAAVCELDGIEIDCNDRMVTGTNAELKCLNGYRNVDDGDDQVLTCGDNGEWNDIPSACEQICGRIPVTKAVDLEQDYNDGDKDHDDGHVAIATAPWHAIIYKKNVSGDFNEICGGTIIDTKAVVSAKNCFWDSAIIAPLPAAEFRVAVGKLGRDFNDDQNDDYQVFSVDNIYYMEGDGQLYEQDLAVIIVSNHIQYNVNVTPICLSNRNSDNDSHNELGRIVYWEPLNNTLKSIDVKVQLDNNCDKNFIILDILAEQMYVTQTSDMGNGVAYPEIENNKTIYYLRGIRTAAEMPENCGPNKIGYRSIRKYIDFINQRAIMHRIPSMIAGTKSTRSCKITQVPQNGVILTVDQLNTCQRQQDLVKHFQAIQYICLDSYRLIGLQSNLCVNGMWSNAPPRCEEIKPKQSGICFKLFCFFFYFLFL